MITRFLEVVSDALLIGALALPGHCLRTGNSAQAPAESAPEQCETVSARIDGARDRMNAALEEVSGRVRAETQRATARAQRAIAAAQTAAAAHIEEISAAFDGTGWIGVRIEEVTAEKGKELKLPAERGALVTSVAEGSPAAKAGLKANDVVTEFNGQKVEGTAALRRLVREVPPGRSVPVTVWRDGRAQALTVEIGSSHASGGRSGRHEFRELLVPEIAEGIEDLEIEIPPMPAMPRIEVGPIAAFRTFGAPLIGIGAEDLSGQLGSYFGAPDGEAVLVREVLPGTPAEKAGLKAGDVITNVDGKRVRTVEDLRSKLRQKAEKQEEGSGEEKKPAQSVSLTLLRKGAEMTVRVEFQAPVQRRKIARRASV